MRVRSSTPSGPTASSAVPPWRVMLAAISARISSQMPSERGAAKACSCTADSPEDRGRPDDGVGLLVDLQAQLHAGDAGDATGTPRSSRPSVVLDLGAVERTGARLGAVATVSSVAPASKSSTVEVSPSRVASAAATSAVVCATSSAESTTPCRRRGREVAEVDSDGSAAFLLVRRKMLTGLVSPSVGRAVRGQRDGPGAEAPAGSVSSVPPWLPGSESTSRNRRPAHLLDHELGDAVTAAHGERPREGRG